MTVPITTAPGTALPWHQADDDNNRQAVISGEHTEVCTCWHHSVGSLEKAMFANAAYIVHACNTLPALQEHADAMAEALAQRDRTAAECPVDSSNPVIRKQSQDRCIICGSGVRDACGRKSSADYAFVETARAALAAYQATKP